MTDDDDSYVAQELRRLAELQGSVVTIAAEPYLTELNADAIRHWTQATGDRNPRYRPSQDGSSVAPPAILYAFSPLAVGYRGGLGGFHSLFGGSQWRWHHPLIAPAAITAESRFTGVEQLASRFAGRMFKQTTTTSFHDQDGTCLAEVSSWGMRTRRGATPGTRRTGPRAPRPQPEYDIAQLSDDYRAEAELFDPARDTRAPRAGDQLPEMIRGPYTTATAVGFAQAWGGVFIAAHGPWFEQLARRPKLGVSGSSGAPESPESVHWNPLAAQAAGLPDAYDYGPERVAWAATFLTNWLGDRGRLTELYCEVRGFNYVGDLIRFTGAVSDRDDGQDGGADAEEMHVTFEGTNQRGERPVFGWARAHLPRAGEPS